MIFNGTDLSPWLEVMSINRPMLASRRLNTTDVSGMNGSYVSDDALESESITVECAIRAESPDEVAEVRRMLASLLLTSKAAKLVLDDEPTLYYLAWCKGGIDTERSHSWPSVTVEFLLADPIAYGEERNAAVGASGGTVRNRGTCKAFPTITCTPPNGSSWKLSNTDTGDYIEVQANFDGSIGVVLDTATESCKVNGAYHPVTLGSDFFPLEPGSQALKTSGGTAELNWVERWL